MSRPQAPPPRASRPAAPPLPRRHRPDGAATRDRIHAAALALFRKNGYDATSMRDVARRARVSLGLAYHYFPSKPALALAYYDARQREHSATARALVARTPTLGARVAGIVHSKLDLVADDRDLLGSLTRVLLHPTDPLGAFSPETRELRDDAVAVFREALDVPSVPEHLRDALATALWAGHMGVLLYWLYDDSPAQARTRALVDAFAALVEPALFLVAQPVPGVPAALAALVGTLEAAGLVIHPAEPVPAPAAALGSRSRSPSRRRGRSG